MAGQKIVSIDFGSRNLHIVEGVSKEGTVYVSKAFLLDAPAGVYADGRIEDKKTLKVLLQTSLKKQRVSARNVVFTLQSSSVITRDMTLPVMKPAELENAVCYEMEQYLPALTSGYSIEHRVIAEVTEENVKKYRIRAAAMPVDMAAQYYSLAKELGLKPLALDINFNSISKLLLADAVVNGERMNDKTVAMIDYGYKSISVNIISKGILEFSRVVGVGGRELDLVLSSNYDIPLEEAEQKKQNEVRLDQLSRNPDAPGSAESQLYDAASQQLSEIQKVLQYYNNRSRENRIDAVLVYGGSSKMKGMSEFIKAQLNLTNVDQIKSINKAVYKNNDSGSAEIQFYLNAIGAMLRL